MESKFDGKLEKDAAPISPEREQIEEISEIVEYFEGNRGLAEVENDRPANNNMVLSNQTNSSSVIRIENSRQITLGNVFNIGMLTGNGGVQAMQPLVRREPPYAKTNTIKEMMLSTNPISPSFLDILSERFGVRWKEVTILLKIDKLFVERMFEDYDKRGGSKEVVYQILSQFFKDNDEQATVGWIITFLWRNGFKEQVWNMREPWKQLKDLEKDLEN